MRLANTAYPLRRFADAARWTRLPLGERDGEMTEAEFHELLLRASDEAIRFARRYVAQELPCTAKYHVELNQSFDGHATSDEVLYPADDGKEVTLVSAETVLALLYRDGRCPEWIDVSVEAVGTGFTLLRLLCCGRFTSDLQKMYYNDRGFGAFGIKSPYLPKNYTDGSQFEIPYI